MLRLEFAQRAHDDLEGIVGYTTTTWGKSQASRYIDGLEDLLSRLRNHPGLGLACDDLAPGMRAIPYRRHVLYYVVESDLLTVVRVLHKRMNPTL